MSLHRWIATLAMILFLFLFLVVGPAARADDAPAAQAGAEAAGEPVRAVRTHDLKPRSRLVFRGRALSYAGFGALGAGAVLAPLGAGLGAYAFHGDPFDKWRYDRVFEERRAASLPLEITGFTLLGAHVPMLMSGVLVEGYGLRRVTRLSVVPGWVGLSLILTGAIIVPFSPVNIVVGSTIMLGGYVCVLTQFGLNVRASRRLDPVIHDELYRPRKAVSVGAIPLLFKGGGGAALVMSF